MARERELKVRIIGEDRASGSIKGVGDSLDHLGPAGERAGGVLGRVQDALGKFGGSIGQKVNAGIDGIVGKITSMPPAAQAATAGVGALAAGVGILAAKGLQNFVDNAQKVRDFGRAAGTSAEVSSQFVSALDDMGIEADAGASSLFKLAKNAETNAVALEGMGVTVARTSAGAVDMKGTFLNVADAFAAQPDPAKRAELAVAAFGKAGMNLIPILEKGRAGIEEMFGNADLAFSQEDLDSAEEYRLALDHLGDSVGKLERSVGQGLVPVLADVADAAANAIDGIDSIDVDKIMAPWAQDSFKAPWEALADPTGIDQANKPLDKLLVGLGILHERGGEAKASADSLTASTLAQADAHGTAAQQAEEEAAALDGLRQATIAGFNSALAYEQSLDRLEDANTALAAASKTAADAVAAHGASSTQAKAAQEALDDELRGARGDYLGAAAAAVKQAEDQAKASGATWDGQRATAVYKDELVRLAQGLAPGSPLRVFLDEYIAKLRSIPASVNTHVTTSGGGGALAAQGRTGPIRKFAAGGHPPVGEAVVLGEDGPEVVTFGRPATVHPTGTNVVPFQRATVASGERDMADAPMTVNLYLSAPQYVGDRRDLADAFEAMLSSGRLVDAVHSALLRKSARNNGLGLA